MSPIEAGGFSVPGTDIAPVTFAKVARMAHLGHKLPAGNGAGARRDGVL